MNAIQIPGKPITLEQAAHLLAEAVTPGNPDAVQKSLHFLLFKAQRGEVRGRDPDTWEPLDTDGIWPGDYASRLFLLPDDLRGLAAERGLRVADDDASRMRGAHVAEAAPAPAPQTATPEQPQAAALAPVVAESASKSPPRKRRDLLTPAIEAAQRECGDAFDSPAVWAALVKMAEAQKYRLLGVTEEGIKWTDANDAIKFFTLRNLRDRLRTRKRRAR